MKRNKIIVAVRRDERFSPNNVDNDRAILRAVADRLGDNIPMIDEARMDADATDADIILTMGRLPQTVTELKKREDDGVAVINSGYGIEGCTRSRLDKTMRENGIPMPPMVGEHGYWLKRGDAAAQSKKDVVYCKDEQALTQAKVDFASRGITDVVVSAHVCGDLIKFYGVTGGFFRYYYPSDDHRSKFGDEIHNGDAHHYDFEVEMLKETAARLAKMVKIDVYGGDAIIDAEGRISIIDFNDWPSFSRCREEAADAIAKYITDNYEQF
jgi:glutathione synthase/RimK-type ligase-like ATP-grasp enzyme